MHACNRYLITIFFLLSVYIFLFYFFVFYYSLSLPVWIVSNVMVSFFFFVAKCKSWLLYISTDYVFDGKDPPYQVDAKPNPLNKYGLSKLQGEEIVQKACKGKLIFPIYKLHYQTPLPQSDVTQVQFLVEYKCSKTHKYGTWCHLA